MSPKTTICTEVFGFDESADPFKSSVCTALVAFLPSVDGRVAISLASYLDGSNSNRFVNSVDRITSPSSIVIFPDATDTIILTPYHSFSISTRILCYSHNLRKLEGGSAS